MAAIFIERVSSVAPMGALVKVLGPVPAGEEWIVGVRVCNVGSGDDVFDLRHRRTDGSNAGYRCRTEAVRLGAAFDVETFLPMSAGEELWHRSGAGFVDASYTGTRSLTA